jgi:hypothetical protein
VAEAQTLLSGEKEISAENSAEAITATSQIITGLLVRALKANAASVRIGPSTVGATSYFLEAGESVQLDVIDPSRFYIYGKKGDKVAFFGLVP